MINRDYIKDRTTKIYFGEKKIVLSVLRKYFVTFTQLEKKPTRKFLFFSNGNKMREREQ